MRAVVQRVNKTSVSVGDKIVGQIDKGLFLLLGVANSDTSEDVQTLATKVSKLRVMPDDEDKMNLSVLDKNSPVLVVSQFTLLANTKKGNRPSFIESAEPRLAKQLYEEFVTNLNELGVKTQTGSFGKYMLIDTQMDGPVTIILDTKEA